MAAAIVGTAVTAAMNESNKKGDRYDTQDVADNRSVAGGESKGAGVNAAQMNTPQGTEATGSSGNDWSSRADMVQSTEIPQ
jgi:hypothetical protein